MKVNPPTSPVGAGGSAALKTKHPLEKSKTEVLASYYYTLYIAAAWWEIWMQGISALPNNKEINNKTDTESRSLYHCVATELEWDKES